MGDYGLGSGLQYTSHTFRRLPFAQRGREVRQSYVGWNAAGPRSLTSCHYSLSLTGVMHCVAY